MQDRLTKLRAQLKAQKLDGFIVPHNDEFQNEYLPPNAERLAYITGFTGSAGTAIVMMDKAVLFADGRYTIQAENQLAKDQFELAHLIENPPDEWLAHTLKPGMQFGYDPWLHTPKQVEKLEAVVEKAGAQLVAVRDNPVDAIWDHRPPASAAPIHLHPLEFAGESTQTKRTMLGEKLRSDYVDAAIITDPASIAWLLNIRGGDVPHNPVALSHAILHEDGAVDWFVDPAKRGNLHIEGVRVHSCADFSTLLGDMMGKRVLADPATAASAVFERLRAGGAEIVRGPDPCALPKACKNAVELGGSRAAHARDGAALSNFLAWLADADHANLTELDIVAKLEKFRAASNLYRGPSFDTIAGSGPHGAIVHYRADETSNRALDENNLLLLDSGAQYQDGTTDITRTIAIGTPRHDMREMFTLVLKGHIALATIRFPVGTSGGQLDVLARQFLWTRGLTYDHGTGHGVGSYLSVHEGPARISGKGDPVALQPGMILSNEPGYYETGEYGIRIENLITVKKAEDGYLEFETISLAPIDRSLIIADMLTRSERTWVNQYHARVQATLTPLVDATTAAWLKTVCEPL